MPVFLQFNNEINVKSQQRNYFSGAIFIENSAIKKREYL